LNPRLRIGTRGSQLALAQANWVRQAIEQLNPGLNCELVKIKTSGDRFTDRPLRSIGGKGLFIKEIEEALIAGDIDCAVHSMKDLPGDLAPGLIIAAVPVREDPRDLFIARDGGALSEQAPGARVGTSSLRRTAFVRRLRPDLELLELRGNVDSRLRKLDAGEIDAVLLAAAGLKRLAIDRTRTHALDPMEFIPAIGQGALAIESRSGETEALLAPLSHEPTRIATTAERSFLRRVGGSCFTPLGAHANVRGDSLDIHAMIATPDGSRMVRGQRSGSCTEAEQIGESLAAELLAAGGAEILRDLEMAAE
jgi:hydroxymethylbilane synthase